MVNGDMKIRSRSED